MNNVFQSSEGSGTFTPIFSLNNCYLRQLVTLLNKEKGKSAEQMGEKENLHMYKVGVRYVTKQNNKSFFADGIMMKHVIFGKRKLIKMCFII